LRGRICQDSDHAGAETEAEACALNDTAPRQRTIEMFHEFLQPDFDVMDFF
jgi:hypothetical protein